MHPVLPFFDGGSRNHPIPVAIGRLVIRVKFISLVNLILDKLAVKELIQKDCTLEAVADELDHLLNKKAHRQQVLDDYESLRQG